MMDIKKLPKYLYDRAVSLKITEIHLNFNGGSDEGYLNVDLELDGERNIDALNDFTDAVVAWAWDVYSYSGAGDGTDYGDTITYDLVNKKMTADEWAMQRVEGDNAQTKLEIG